MGLSAEEQYVVQGIIDKSNEDEILELQHKSKLALLEMNSKSSYGIHTAEERKACYVAIEYLARIDATQRGKGAFYRMKKRISLVALYLS